MAPTPTPNKKKPSPLFLLPNVDKGGQASNEELARRPPTPYYPPGIMSADSAKAWARLAQAQKDKGKAEAEAKARAEAVSREVKQEDAGAGSSGSSGLKK